MSLLLAQSVSLRDARRCPELGVKPTGGMNARISQFDPDGPDRAWPFDPKVCSLPKGTADPATRILVVPQFEIWYVEYFAVSFACSEAIGAFFDGWRSMQLRCCHALASRRAIQDSRCLSLHRLPTPNRRAVRCRRLLLR